jgi:hypothetical protein
MSCSWCNPNLARGDFLLQGGSDLSGIGLQANFMQGYDFVVSKQDIRLTSFGFWDQGSDGVPDSYQVGLWDTNTQELLVSVLIDNSDSLDQSLTIAGGQYRVETIGSLGNGSLVLHAGHTYTIAYQVGPAELSRIDTLAIEQGTIISSPLVEIVEQARFLSTPSFTFPTQTFDLSGGLRGNVNAQFSLIPEPSFAMLLSLGFFWLTALPNRSRVP